MTLLTAGMEMARTGLACLVRAICLSPAVSQAASEWTLSPSCWSCAGSRQLQREQQSQPR